MNALFTISNVIRAMRIILRHPHQRIEEHKASVIGKHMKEVRGVAFTDLAEMFSVLKKCRGKLGCLIQEMLFIRERKPKLRSFH